MGILDRIAGTLEELTGDANSEANGDIARAQDMADAGDLAAAEAALIELTGRLPRFAPAHAALGRTRVRRGDAHLDDAVTAFGRAVDLDSGDAPTWYALGDALAALGRAEPALDALRRVLTLSLDLSLQARTHAALGRIHAREGQWTAALRSFRKALELGGQHETDRIVALDYGRTLAAVGEREATEWLTRAARADGADVHVFIEAAAATSDDALAGKLLAEGLARAPADRPLRAALARRLARLGRSDEAIAIAEACVAEAPGDVAALAALRETYADAGRARDGLRIAADEARAGNPPPLATRVALALAAGDRDALMAMSQELPAAAADGELHAALRAFVDRKADTMALLRLGRIAPGAAARAFVARDVAPQPPPAGQLAGLLTWTHDFFTASASLGSLAAAAGHAADALDRPLLVAVMGEFNAGKSSFVNALAGEEVAPTGVTPTTATVNVLRYGPTPAARVVAHDGSARDLPAADIARFVTSMDDEATRGVRLVEIFLPVETLRRVEIVDTPGLNSIRPEHERVARDFLQEADAIVWVFGIGQAAKATEKAALELARSAGKRVVGVLNKIDRADAAEIEAVAAHVARSLGDLVETVVPFSATRALAARRAGKSDATMTALTAALDERFFTQALGLKRATAVSALGRLLAAGRAAADAAAPAPRDFAAAHAEVARLQQAVSGALDGERVALRARIHEGYRRAALEVREFVRPRAWLFGEHRATPADEEFLGELLDDSVTRALERTRATLRAALADAGIDTTAIAATIDTALDRFAAYARGVIEGGAVPDFFRTQLPRLRLEVAAIRDALARRAPDPAEALFSPLRRELTARVHAIADDVTAAEVDAEMRALIHEHGLQRPLAALDAALQAL